MWLWHLWSLKIYDFAKMAFVCEWHGMGYKVIYWNLYKSIPHQEQYMGYREMCCSLCQAFPINLYDPYIKTDPTITKIWWLVTSTLKVTVCTFDSFVCDTDILDPHKILWFCSIVIWTFLALVRFCDFAKMALVCESHDMGYRDKDCNLYKTGPAILKIA